MDDVETALRFQKLEMEVSALRADLAANTAVTEKLLAAWEGSNATLSFIKGCAIFGASVLAIWAGIRNLMGH